MISWDQRAVLRLLYLLSKPTIISLIVTFLLVSSPNLSCLLAQEHSIDSPSTTCPEATTTIDATTKYGPSVTSTDQQATLVLGGKFNEVVGSGVENKRKFLTECTRKLSNNNARSVECIDVRPGSVIVVIGGELDAVVEAVQSVQSAGSLELDGYEKMKVENVILPMSSSPSPTSQPPTTKPEFVLVVIIAVVAFDLILAAILICLYCKCCKTKDPAKDVKDVPGSHILPSKHRSEEKEDEEDPEEFITETLVETAIEPKRSSASNTSAQNTAQEVDEVETTPEDV